MLSSRWPRSPSLGKCSRGFAAHRGTAATATTSASVKRSMSCIQEQPTEGVRANAREMARSDPRPGVRVTRGAGSSNISRLSCKRAGKARTLMPVWDSSGESQFNGICEMGRAVCRVFPADRGAVRRRGAGETITSPKGVDRVRDDGAKEGDRSVAFLLKAGPMSRSFILRAKTRLDAVKERLYQKRTERDIFWLAKRIICYNNYRPFKFVEIGVFKGDTAVSIIKLVQKYGVKVEYVGFDLFEDIEEFFESHQADRAYYDTDEYPYWEFKSGEHALSQG
jgi:hypothetical protein